MKDKCRIPTYQQVPMPIETYQALVKIAEELKIESECNLEPVAILCDRLSKMDLDSLKIAFEMGEDLKLLTQ